MFSIGELPFGGRHVEWQKIAIGAVGAIILLFVGYRILDILMIWSTYSWFFQSIKATGLPDGLTGAVSVLFTIGLLWLIPTIMSAVFFGRRRAMLITGGAIASYMVLMYFLSQPKPGEYFNPFTGAPRFMYYLDQKSGNIELFPLGYKYHPKFGAELSVLTQEVATDKLRTGKVQQSGMPDSVVSTESSITASSSTRPLRPECRGATYARYDGESYGVLSVEAIGHDAGSMVARMCASFPPLQETLVFLPSDTASIYLTDDAGNIYPLISRGGEWSEVARGSAVDRAFVGRKLRTGELYYFDLRFKGDPPASAQRFAVYVAGYGLMSR